MVYDFDTKSKSIYDRVIEKYYISSKRLIVYSSNELAERISKLDDKKQYVINSYFGLKDDNKKSIRQIASDLECSRTNVEHIISVQFARLQLYEIVVVVDESIIEKSSINEEKKERLKDALQKLDNKAVAPEQELIEFALKKFEQKQSIPITEKRIDNKDFNLSKITYGILKNAGLVTFGDIVSMDMDYYTGKIIPNGYRKLVGFGPARLNEILELVHRYGYTIKGEMSQEEIEKYKNEQEKYKIDKKVENIDSKISKLQEQINQLEQLKESIKNGNNTPKM